MKKQIFTYFKYAGLLLCSALLLFSCSKSDGPGNESDPVDKVKIATATFTKKNIKAYPATFPGSRYDQIGIMNEHIYVMNDDSKKFRRYSLRFDLWEDLANENSLPGGISGYLTAHRGANNKNILVYLGGNQGKLNIYYPSEYPDATLKDTWATKIVMTEEENGERAAASDGEYVYFMGNSRAENYTGQIDRYVPAHDLWEESIGYLPEGIGWIPQTVFADNKLFVTGQNLANDGNVFFVYDLLTQTSTSKSVPFDLEVSGICNNTVVVYDNYLIYMLPAGSSSVKLRVYDLEEEQWLEDAVAIEMNLFTKTSDNASLLLSSSGRLYAAGTKGGDFVLYEVDFKITEQ